MTTDRLALASVLRDNGIGDQRKAENVATAIMDAIASNVATKADMQAGVAELRGEMRSGFARQDVAIERLRSSVREMESRLMLRLGGAMAILFGLFFAALHYWPPHG
jgi:hypothetical protein